MKILLQTGEKITGVEMEEIVAWGRQDLLYSAERACS